MPRWFVTGAGASWPPRSSVPRRRGAAQRREAALDIRDAAAVRVAVHAFAPDVILHTAAYTNVDGAEGDPETAAAINVLGTRNVIEAVRGTHTQVVYFSSDYVFDGAKGAPYVESDEPYPLSVYGRTKLAGEAEVLGWARGIVVRTSWLFSETGANFVKTILAAGVSKAASGESLRSWTTRSACREPAPGGGSRSAGAAPRREPWRLPHERRRLLLVGSNSLARFCSSPGSRSR